MLKAAPTARALAFVCVVTAITGCGGAEEPIIGAPILITSSPSPTPTATATPTPIASPSPTPSPAPVDFLIYIPRYDDNRVSAIQMGLSGDKILSSTTPTGNRPYMVATDPLRKVAYAVNNLASTISKFSIDASSGSLSGGTTIPSGAKYPTALTLSPSGQFLYAVNDNVNNGPGVIGIFSVNAASGDLSPLGTVSTGDRPFGLAMHPSGKFLYSTNSASDTTSLFVIDPVDGSLSPKRDYPSGDNPLGIAIHASGYFLYIANRDDNTVSIFTVNTTDGTLSAAGTVPSGLNPQRPAIDPTGTFLAVPNGGSDTISIYRIEPSTGSLTEILPRTPSGDLPSGVAFDPSGSFLYSTNFLSDDLSAYQFNLSTGSLTELSFSPILVGGAPISICVVPVP